MKNLILGYTRGRHRFQCLETALDNCDIVTENFDKIKGPYDRIYTISESLLPIQAKLEKEWGIKNVSERAADILSDKKKFDDLCISIGLQSLIPHNIIPTKPDDLDYWKDKPFIVKPVVGSGSKPGGLNYISLKKAVDAGVFKSHFEHYQLKGRKEGKKYVRKQNQEEGTH